MKYKIAAGTNAGLIRQNNEDNFVVCPDLTSSDWRIPQVSDYADLGEFGALLVVADGMGGANAGEVASAIAVETIQQSFVPECLKNVITDDKAIQEFMKEAVKAADLNIYDCSRNDSNTQGMGTTIVMAWVLNGKIYLCWCGDSRCYLLNRQKGLIRLSKDHSYVQELIDNGELDPEFAMAHPLSNVITRCLGNAENRAVPETRIFHLYDGDTILLCTDGLSGLCDDVQILDLLIEFRDDPEECKEQLIAAALNEGGHDNVTVALCNIQMEQQESHTEDGENQVALPFKEELSETVTPVHGHRSNGQKWLSIIVLTFAVIAITFLVMKKNSPMRVEKSNIDSIVDNSQGYDSIIDSPQGYGSGIEPKGTLDKSSTPIVNDEAFEDIIINPDSAGEQNEEADSI